MSTEKYMSAAEKLIPVFATKQPYGQGARLGTLSLAGRKPINTPHYLALTSRGLIPHITQDNLKSHFNVRSVHFPLEDFVEKLPQVSPPIYNLHPHAEEPSIRKFTALPEETVVVLGARRVLPVTATSSNTDQAISICTSVGFRWLSSTAYLHAIERLRPDIVIGLTDVANSNPTSVKRLEKAVIRTTRWTAQLFDELPKLLGEGNNPWTHVFAPVLPLSYEKQYEQFEILQENLGKWLTGLALSDTRTIDALPSKFLPLPRLLSSACANFTELLQAVGVGFDIITVPFIGKATDAGIALTCSFPAEAFDTTQNRLVAGKDLWQEQYSTDISPIQSSCHCYTCRKHHRAYIHHLLKTKEMLAWVLLQIHNYWILDRFFEGIRVSIQDGVFEMEKVKFEGAYETEFPQGSGLGPRVRGYHVKTGPNQPKRNLAPFVRMS